MTMMRRLVEPVRHAPYVLIGLFMLCTHSARGGQPWWDDYPRIVQGPAALLKTYDADVVFAGGLHAPAWGIWGQVLFGRPQVAVEIHAQGGRMLSYFETFGQSYCVIVSVPDAELNTEHPKPSASHWSWQSYNGDPIYWAGAHSWFDDLPEARPYTRTHPVYGGPPMRYPDGRIATGYDGDPNDPLNHRVFDAGCSKNVLGEISFETHAIAKAVEENGPHTGLPVIDGVHAGVLLMQKDSACPHWLDLDEAAVRYSAGHGSDGMWSDNYSPWDSFSVRPIDRGFGDWSVALFRDYLKTHFDDAALRRMSVDDVDTFDVRAAFRKQVRDWGGDDTNLRDAVWRDARWLDHELWHAYMIHKRQTGTRALEAYDQRMHAAARDVGKPDYLIAGNDIPGLSLGWVRGGLDLVSTESSAGYALDAGSRGLLLPPVGRHSVRYRLAAVHARSRLVNIWPYLDGKYEPYRRNPNLTRVMAYEMLAAGALPMPHPGLPRVLGDEKAYREFFTFVGKARERFGRRVPHARTGVYYSASSLLAFMTPGGFLDFNARPHQFGFYGWATALHDMHTPYVPVPEWQLTAETLASLDLLIIPHAAVLNEAAITGVLMPWVAQGGRLLITGDCGIRAGEAGNFALHGQGPLHARLESRDVTHVDENVGMDYFLQDEQRDTLLPGMRAQMDAARGKAIAPVFTAPNEPATTGLTPYYDQETQTYFVDVNNLAIDVESDSVTTMDEVTFDVTLPAALRDAQVTCTVIAPHDGTTCDMVERDGPLVRIRVGPVPYYASVIIAPAE